MGRNDAVKLTTTSALAAVLGVLAAGAAFGQLAPAPAMDRPAVTSALEECETGAWQGVLTGRALGACDVALSAPDLDDAIRARILVNRGVIALKRNETGPARGDLEQAVQLAPDLADAWLTLSAARIKARDLTGAIEAAQRALDLGVSQPALAHFNIAIAEETAGRYDPAYDAYVRAAGLAPDDSVLQAQPARFLRHRSPPAPPLR
jgi:tetratricopeptide (TPR) repeat protein